MKLKFPIIFIGTFLILLPQLILNSNSLYSHALSLGRIILLQASSESGSLSTQDPIICGVSFVSPWFEVKDKATNIPLLLIDSNGNLYVNSSTFVTGTNPSDTGWTNAFIVKKSTDVWWVFTKSQSTIYGNVVQTSTPTYDSGDLVIKRSDGTILVVFDGSTGDIYVKGIPVYQGAQAGCPSDGWYCTTGNVKEYRDYYCNAPTGACEYTVTSSYDCDNLDCTYNCYNYCDTSTGDIRKKCDDYICSNGSCIVSGDRDCGLVEDCSDTATDSDSDSDHPNGDNPFVAGTCTDYELCSAGDTSCPSTTYSDYCYAADTVYEYYISGTDCVGTAINCTDYYNSTKCISCGLNGYPYYCCYCLNGACICDCETTQVGTCWLTSKCPV